MEKKVNGTWLFLVLLMALLVFVIALTFADQSADSFSGGMLVQSAVQAGEQCMAIPGGVQ